MSRYGAFAFRVPKAEATDQLQGDWSLRNACVGFSQKRSNHNEALFRAHFVSYANEAAVIWGFSEYTFGLERLAVVRNAEASDEVSRQSCTRRPLGLAMTISSNNLYHQFMHAVYSYQKLRHHAGPEAELVPLATSRAHAWFHPITNSSHSWEFSVRPYTAKPGAEILQETLGLIRRRCTCYDRIEGATGGVSLYNPASLPRILTFCRGALRIARSIRLPMRVDTEVRAEARPTAAIVLYESRKSTRRAITNDADITRALCPGNPTSASGGNDWQGSCVSLGTLSIVEQMRTIASVCERSRGCARPGHDVDALHAGEASERCYRRDSFPQAL